MKTRKEFEHEVKMMREFIAERYNGRRVVVLSEYSKKGQQIIEMASRHEGFQLSHVYNHWSYKKEEAFKGACQMFSNTPNSSHFGICSHNTYAFTVSWVSPVGVHFLTYATEYIVVCND